MSSIASAFTGASLASPWLASDAGYLAWTWDPSEGISSGTALTTGQVSLMRVNVRGPVSCTNVVLNIGTAGTLLTAAQNFAGLYNSAGTLIGTSADQSAAWTTAGVYTTPLAGGPFSLPAGFYWVACLSNSTGTPPSLIRTTNLTAGFANQGLTAAQSRYATNGTGTTLPGSITPASNVQVVNQYWAALS